MSRCAKLLGDAVGANSTVPMKDYLWLDPVYENTFSGAANILEADSASEDVIVNYEIPAQEVEMSKDHPDNLGRNVTYRSRLGRKEMAKLKNNVTGRTLKLPTQKAGEVEKEEMLVTISKRGAVVRQQ
ncbi:hypothetical protein NDU88_005706 [Pleurodeles waltl]|uniref:Uncharacterized protein n=1 Tax=Pleurodeles waltl TaxID=8319 RepID=A0AAV7QJ15_PLEWA|nr:hypothetical protein NDU88_005706 [Pleurodeles waltl]